MAWPPRKVVELVQPKPRAIAGTSGSTGSAGTSGTTGTPGSSGTSGSSGSSSSSGTSGTSGSTLTGLTLYFHSDADGTIPNYWALKRIYVDAGTTSTANGIGGAGTHQLHFNGTSGAWATMEGVPGVGFIPAGLWGFHIYLDVDSAVGSTYFMASVLKRGTDGTETELFNVTSPEINDTTATLQEINSAQSEVTLALSDRIVVKPYMINGGVPTRRLTMSFGTSAVASHIETPLTVGAAGSSGTSGTSGSSGSSGSSGTSGTSGSSGTSGTSGSSGSSSTSGSSGTSTTAAYPFWQILAAETINVGDRQQYAVFGTLDLQGTITLAAGAELVIHT